MIPPLLYAAAIQSAWSTCVAPGAGSPRSPFGLVLATAGAVALVAHLVVPDLPLSAALALGATPATVTGALSVGDGAVRFLVASVGGVLVGLAVAGSSGWSGRASTPCSSRTPCPS